MAYTIKDYLNSFRTKLSDTISKQQIEPVRKTKYFSKEKKKRKTNLVAIRCWWSTLSNSNWWVKKSKENRVEKMLMMKYWKIIDRIHWEIIPHRDLFHSTLLLLLLFQWIMSLIHRWEIHLSLHSLMERSFSIVFYSFDKNLHENHPYPMSKSSLHQNLHVSHIDTKIPQ